MATHLDVFPADDILWKLIAQGFVTWEVVLKLGGVDPLEAEHRELVEARVQHGVAIVVTEPL